MSEQRLIIAVIGGAECTTNEAMQAAHVGRLLAEHGAVLICGGRSGVMEIWHNDATKKRCWPHTP